MGDTLRVIDDGLVSALRSQALWHGIASSMKPGDPTTLSFCQPSEPYVCIGFHRQLAEVDLDACRRLGLPIIRRQIGGGPVLIDRDQLFFQITMPADRAPLRIDRLYRDLLGPAVEAFRRLGVGAELQGVNEIVDGHRRLSGTGAGRIGEAVTVVGNIIFHFDYHRMSEVLALPSEAMRSECLRLMERHVGSVYGDQLATSSVAAVKAAWIETYSAAVAGAVEHEDTSPAEEREIARWESRFGRPDWLRGPSPKIRLGRQVKIWAGAWVFENSRDGVTVRASIVDGNFELVTVDSAHLNGVGEEMSAALKGHSAQLQAVEECLADYGAAGRQVTELLAPGLELR